MATLSATGNGTTSPRRHRYSRASTTSVTQLLSDGYSSIMNRLTRRGPSEKSDAIADSKLTAARTRYDDKLLTNKNPTLANMRRFENNRHISPYTSLLPGMTTSTVRKLNDDRGYSGYLGAPKPRIEMSPLHSTTSSINALSRSDSFRRAQTKGNKSSPFTKRYPLKEANHNIDSTLSLGSTRSRLEDKYSSVLDRIASQKKEKARKDKEDRDKTLEPEPSMPRGLMRSLTTAVFGENSFRRNQFSREKTRDKTPFKNTGDRRLSSQKQKDKDEYKNGFDIPLRDRQNYGKDRDSIYRRHQRRSLRAEKSETKDRKGKLCLRPIDISLHSGVRDLISPLQQNIIDSTLKSKTTKTPASSPSREIGRQKQIYFPSSDEEDDDKTPVGDQVMTDRETRRKEIQSLIMKYAHLDEVYGRIGEKEANAVSSDAVTKKTEPLGVGDVVALPPELRSRQRPQRPRHLLRRAVTPPVSTR
ncbi:uncharacterized protein LOC132901766 [Amyelois transitella]|uniref:uncharacterized protein LOC132901766 n=1 Tax=Amyelois transitella TaxID=680683 RepID=UPI00298F6C66|nr:uncharacterized protein LOC132901766 [Amyelois transitella]